MNYQTVVMNEKRYHEIVDWMQSNYPDEKFLWEKTMDKVVELFSKLPDDIWAEFSEHPTFVITKEGTAGDYFHKDALLNPFFYLILMAASKTIYEIVMNNINKKDLKICSNCKKENPNDARYCVDCGKDL